MKMKIIEKQKIRFSTAFNSNVTKRPKISDGLHNNEMYRKIQIFYFSLHKKNQ